MQNICDKQKGLIQLGLANSAMPFWKRSFDLLCCLIALPLLAVCTLLMTVLTKAVSPGPIFFRQERIGHKGRRFKIYKFRTMRLGADTSAHQNYYKELIGTNAPMLKMDSRGDSRLIFGAWLLRASGLDELPQVINVLQGEMSFVGPRPCIPSEYEQYLPSQQQRSNAVPGLTGLWQVSGKNRTTFEEMIRLDIEYSKNLSPWQDLKIIALTIPSLLTQIHDTHLGRKSLRKPRKAPTTLRPLQTAIHSRSPF